MVKYLSMFAGHPLLSTKLNSKQLGDVFEWLGNCHIYMLKFKKASIISIFIQSNPWASKDEQGNKNPLPILKLSFSGSISFI